MKSHTLFASLLVLASTAAIAGCNTSTGTEPPDTDCSDGDQTGCVVASDKQRIQSPDVPAADQAALANGNSAFALDLYHQISKKDGNLFYSPYSISTALAMTWAGARNQTEKDMASALRFDLPQAKLHPAFNWLDQELESRGQGAQGADGKGFRLRAVNALWGQAGYPFEAPFLDTLALNYGAGMRIVDFEDAQGSSDLINGWVEDQTEGKIKKLVPPSAISADTVLILTNAIYFNAAWKVPFEPANTVNGDFQRADSSKVSVPMMHGFQEAPYGEGADYKALVMPYDGDELSMVLVLPTAGDLSNFEASLDAGKLESIISGATEHGVDIQMPTFKFDYELSVKESLKALGMGIAFEGGKADFSGINAKGSPYIQDVLHKAYVGVNEAGTEAAAATAVIVGDTAAPEPAAITLDHPFLFFIRDNATKSILFVGRVVDPS